MPEIKNNFLKGRMNQDLDSRIIPEGEYREAINLLISRSEGATVGEFENVLGNTGYTLPGTNCHVIGHFVDETNNIAYLFSTNYDGNTRATTTNTCNILQVNLSNYSITTLVNGYWLNFSTQYPIYGVNLIDDLLFWTDNFNQPRRINIITAQQPNAYTTESQISVAQYYPYDPIIPLERTTATVKLDNTNNTSTQIVVTTSCPNVKVGDIVTVNNKTQAPGVLEINNQVPPVRVTEIVDTVAPFRTFKVSPAMTSGTPAQAITRLDAGTIIDFSRTTMKNTSEEYLSNFSIQTVDAVGQQGTDIEITDPSFGGLPRVGDIVSLQSTSSGTTLPYYELRVATLAISNTQYNRWRITFDKSMTGPTVAGGSTAATGFQAGDVITIGTNPEYNASFKGDSKFLEDKFIRFSYRFRYENNEYSLMAPFTQIMFIPKQFGQFSLGQLTPDTGQDVNYYQDEVDAYTSTIIQWFENDIDSIKLKIPLPTNLTELNTVYNVKDIDILYRESDALAVKVLDTIELSSVSSTTSINYDDDITGFVTKNYIDYDYKSNKPYKTLPEGQTTRVYDRVPVKALGQELIANRIVYGNYTERMTPPATIDYRTSFSPRDARYSDYATEYPYSTVKQNRTYQIGFVLADYYGRQSDVILSSYDNLSDNEGSSIYVPYRNSGDATDVPVLDWIGQNLTLTIDNAFGNGTDPGQPGVYQEEGCVTGSSLTAGGRSFEVDKTYNVAGTGGAQIRVTAIGTNDAISSYAIVTSGSGYSVNDVLTVVGGDGGGRITVTSIGAANPLGWYSYKVVVKQQEQEYYNVYLPGFINGLPIQNRVWNGTPYSTVASAGGGGTPIYPGTDPIETERNKIFFSTVLSDNINKIPRNLQEVGPTDEEYNSDELLYIRVNNPNAKEITTTGVRNAQYYPGQLVQNVLNISTVKETELAAVPFVPFRIPLNPGVAGALINSVGNERVYGYNGPGGFQGEYGATVQVVPQPLVDSGTYYGAIKNMPTGSIPWGDVADKASFYAADQNPFIMKVGQVSNYNNPVGAIVCGPFLLGTPPAGGNDVPHDTNYTNGVRTMQPILSVAETKPVFSLLDIFWETTLCGKLEQLNAMIETNYNGIVAITDNIGTFSETIGVDGQVGDAFYFVNGTGAQINSYTGLTPTISKVVRQSNTSQALTPIGDYFDIQQTGTAGQYRIRAKKNYWYGDTSTSTDVYIISLNTTWVQGSDTFNDSLDNAITLSLTNAAPSIYSNSARDEQNFTVSMDSTDGPNVIQLFGLNGSADATVVNGTQNKYKQLAWSIGSVVSNPSSSATFAIDSTTGQITASGLVDETAYTFAATVKDANEATGTLSASQNITVNVGTPFAPKAIASGRQGNANLAGAGNSGEWIWGDVTNSYTALGNTLSSNPSLIYNAQKEYQASTNPANSCKAWLFQGTIEIEITMTSSAGPVGDANTTFIIQHRTFTPPNTNNANSRSSWAQIASVVESNFNIQTATSNPQNIAVVVNSNVNTTTYRYKFDQLGEYRLITSSLTGDRAAYASVQVQFKDGMCRNNAAAGYCAANGPCNP